MDDNFYAKVWFYLVHFSVALLVAVGLAKVFGFAVQSYQILVIALGWVILWDTIRGTVDG